MLKSRTLIALDKTVFLSGKGKIMGNKLFILLAIGAISLATFLACDNNRTPGNGYDNGGQPALPEEQTGEVTFGTDGALSANVEGYMTDADWAAAKQAITDALQTVYEIDVFDSWWTNNVIGMFSINNTINIVNDLESNFILDRSDIDNDNININININVINDPETLMLTLRRAIAENFGVDDETYATIPWPTSVTALLDGGRRGSVSHQKVIA